MKKAKYTYLITLFIIIIASCTPTTSETSERNDRGGETIGFVESAWIIDRVTKAKERLSQSSAGQKLLETIEAHGGLEKWFGNGPLSFHFDYQPLDGGKRRNSFQVIDQWSVRAVHQVADNPDFTYGWDGANAWIYPDTAEVGVNPRFWSTTPFYFIGLPFVLADEGVILEELGSKVYKGIAYDLLKASYEPGVGDAPEDFYVIYIHPETKLMGGLRYIVSYPGFFPDGGHLPEKFMEITGLQTAKGITVPTGYNTYWFKEGQPAEHITKIDIPRFTFVPETDQDYFTAPEGAKIQEGL